MLPRVALFVPCFVDQLQPQVAADTVRVLRRIGCQVYFPQAQTCCGQPAFNTGYWKDALPIAERLVSLFRDAEAVVCPSGSCAAMVRHWYPELLAESGMREDAASLGRRVYELSEFLVKVARVTDVGAEFPHCVTFHDSCHALRELRLKDEPRQLLRRVRGLELVEMPYAEECCGFGGTFAAKFSAISAAMGDTKAGNIEAVQADYVTAVDSACLMHLEGIFRRRQCHARAIHIASILAQAAGVETSSGAREATR